MEDYKNENDQLRQDNTQMQTELENIKASGVSLSKAKEMAEFEQRRLKSEINVLQEALSEARVV